MKASRLAAGIAAGGLMGLLLLGSAAQAADPEACQTRAHVRPGLDRHHLDQRHRWRSCWRRWAMSRRSNSLAVPITFQALKNGQIDVFLGNWMPAQSRSGRSRCWRPGSRRAPRQPGRIQVHAGGAELRGGGGVKSFADVGRFPDKFDRKIYGIEPGAPANTEHRPDDQGWRLRPGQLGTGAVERAGHAGAGRPQVPAARTGSSSWPGSRTR